MRPGSVGLGASTRLGSPALGAGTRPVSEESVEVGGALTWDGRGLG